MKGSSILILRKFKRIIKLLFPIKYRKTGIEVNWFALIHLNLEKKFGEDP